LHIDEEQSRVEKFFQNQQKHKKLHQTHASFDDRYCHIDESGCHGHDLSSLLLKREKQERGWNAQNTE